MTQTIQLNPFQLKPNDQQQQYIQTSSMRKYQHFNQKTKLKSDDQKIDVSPEFYQPQIMMNELDTHDQQQQHAANGQAKTEAEWFVILFSSFIYYLKREREERKSVKK